MSIVCNSKHVYSLQNPHFHSAREQRRVTRQSRRVSGLLGSERDCDFSEGPGGHVAFSFVSLDVAAGRMLAR